MAPALAEWEQQEAQWRREANDWARKKLLEHFESDAAFNPMTAGELMAQLDADVSMPTAWARILKTDTVSYRERYSTVRNVLESLARQRIIAMGTTVNAKGREKSTTYSRPRDASDDWDIQIDGTAAAVQRARQGIRDWLQLDGSILDGVTGLKFTPKQRAGGPRSVYEQAAKHEGKPNRNRRATRGTD